jgi:hypothetical protein
MKAAERYALAATSDGGLLLDLESGGLFQLNTTATFVWRQFLDGSEVDAIAATVAGRHGIEAARARADVAAALRPGALPNPPAPEDYEFRRTSSGYLQLYLHRPELEVDAAGTELAILTPQPERRPRRIRNSLRALVPKLMSLRGHTIFHASAVLVRGRLLAFSGRSGAGKTTTARALAAQGATLVSEDKLLTRSDGGGAVAWRAAEAHIEQWVAQATRSLFVEGRVSCVSLDEAARGEELPITEIGFLDIVPRQGSQMITRLLDTKETAAASFCGMFLGTALAAAWRRQLAAAVSFAQGVSGYAVTMPNGLDLLHGAAETLVRRGTLTP